MTRTTTAQFPARRSAQARVTYLGQHHKQPQAKAVALRHPAYPFDAAVSRSGPSLGESARATLEAVRLFWQSRSRR